MVDYVSTNQVPESASHNHVREGPSCNCVARRKRTIGFVVSGAVGPEPSATITFVRPLAIGREFQRFYDKQGVSNRFLSQTTCFGKVTIVGRQPDQVQPAGPSHRPVQANIGDCAARLDSRFVNPEFLLCLRVIVKRNSGSGGERDQPERVSWLDSQRTCPNADLIVADVFETLPRVSDSTCWRRLRGIMLGTLRFARRRARAIAWLGGSRPVTSRIGNLIECDGGQKCQHNKGSITAGQSRGKPSLES